MSEAPANTKQGFKKLIISYYDKSVSRFSILPVAVIVENHCPKKCILKTSRPRQELGFKRNILFHFIPFMKNGNM